MSMPNMYVYVYVYIYIYIYIYICSWLKNGVNKLLEYYLNESLNDDWRQLTVIVHYQIY